MKNNTHFFIISRSVLLRMRNDSDESCRKNPNTYFMLNILYIYIFFFLENRAVCEIMSKNIVEPGRPQLTKWRMPFACWIPKATNTFLHYVIIIAFPLQQWLHEFASRLRYTCIACLVLHKVSALH